MKLKKFQEAEEKLLSSLEINPLNKNVCGALGQIYAYKNKYEEFSICYVEVFIRR